MDKLFTLTSLGFFGIAIFGMVMHAVKKWIYNEIEGDLLDWYRANPKYTAGVFIAVMGATATAISAGTLTSLNDGGMVSACFLLAYGIDGLNKQ